MSSNYIDPVEEFNSNSKDKEFEILFLVDHEFIYQIVNNIKITPRINKHIDIWKGRKRLRKEQGGVEYYHEKSKGIFKYDYVDDIKVKINLKDEIPISKEDFVGKIDQVRYKYTLEYSFGDWQLDISRIFSSDSLTNIKFTSQILKNATSITDLELKSFNEVTMELEFKGKKISTYKDILLDVIAINKQKIAFKPLNYLSQIKQSPSYNIKFLLNKAISLERYKYKDIYNNLDKFLITDKTDGDRAILCCYEKNLYLIGPTTKVIPTDIKKHIFLDGELVDNKFYLFDVIDYEKDKVYEKEYEDRLKYFSKLKDFNFSKIVKVILKKFYDGSSKKFDIYNQKSDYEKDGLIIVPKVSFDNFDSTYFKMSVFKWKPVDKLSIDFLTVKNPNSRNQFYLFCTINWNDFIKSNIKKIKNYEKILKDVKYNKDLFPIQFSTIRDPNLYMFETDDKLAEELKEPNISEYIYNNGWKHIRIRTDRQELLDKGKLFGNYYKVAERNMEAILNPLTLEDLKNFEVKSYFKKNKNEIYYSPNAFNSFVKDKLFRYPNKRNTLIDLAAGKGQDLRRYNYYDYAILIDRDKDALRELMLRKDKIKTTKLRVIEADVMKLTSISNVIQELENTGDCVTINFAIHYLIINISSLKKLHQLVNKILKPKGYFIFTCFDGSKIKEFNLFEKNILKYSIKYKKKTKNLMTTLIDVLLPFSDGQYYTENLVDIKAIINWFESKNFSLIKYDSFSSMFDKFKEESDIYKQLTEQDKEYLSYYSFVILRKI